MLFSCWMWCWKWIFFERNLLRSTFTHCKYTFCHLQVKWHNWQIAIEIYVGCFCIKLAHCQNHKNDDIFVLFRTKWRFVHWLPKKRPFQKRISKNTPSCSFWHLVTRTNIAYSGISFTQKYFSFSFWLSMVYNHNASDD